DPVREDDRLLLGAEIGAGAATCLDLRALGAAGRQQRRPPERGGGKPGPAQEAPPRQTGRQSKPPAELSWGHPWSLLVVVMSRRMVPRQHRPNKRIRRLETILQR